MGARRAGLVQRAPARHREIIGAVKREVRAGEMHPGHRLAQPPAMLGQDAPGPQSVQEGDNGGRPAAQTAQSLAVAGMNRRSATDATASEVLHESEEERQIFGPHPLLIEGQDVAALGRAQQIVGVLHALGDALEGGHLAQLVVLQERLQRLVRNLGVDSHLTLCRGFACGPGR